ncbi:retrovirus polyprotein, partial [Ceratocystis lukuohia]
SGQKISDTDCVKEGLLKPLPIPDQPWQDIAIDFIGPLPTVKKGEEEFTHILTVIDCMSKGVLLMPMKALDMENVADAFFHNYYRHHGLPRSILSDREFVNAAWKMICTELGVERRSTTAYHPATNGAVERMNAETPPPNPDGPLGQAKRVLDKLRSARDWAKANLTMARATMEEAANEKRRPHRDYQPGDWVWLTLRKEHFGPGLGRGLQSKHIRCKVKEKVGSHTYKLDVPGSTAHDTYHADRLRPAADDAFPSQTTHDDCPGPIALNNWVSASTGISPFFFCHGYHIDPIETDASHPTGSSISPATAGHNWLAKHREATAFSQASMALAQEVQERHANKGRQVAESFQVGDRVYLRLKNVHTLRPSKKLDWLALLYKVIGLVGSHAVKLDTPSGIHPVFHVNLVRWHREDPLPSQVSSNPKPPPISQEEATDDTVAGEYQVDKILQHRKYRKQYQVLVKWTGYAEPTWEPLVHLEDTAALEEYEQTTDHPWAT